MPWELLLLATSTARSDLLLYNTTSTSIVVLADSLCDRRVPHHHTTAAPIIAAECILLPSNKHRLGMANTALCRCCWAAMYEPSKYHLQPALRQHCRLPLLTTLPAAAFTH